MVRFGEKADAPHLWLKKRKGFKRLEVMVRGRKRHMRYRIEGPFVRDGLPGIPLMLGERKEDPEPLHPLTAEDDRAIMAL